MATLAQPSTLTQGTEFKSHSTLQKGSIADTTTAAVPRPFQLASTADTPHPHASQGPLTARKLELEKKKMELKKHHHSISKTTNIPIEEAHI